MKIRPVGAELFHMDGPTDRWAYMTKQIVTFRNFVYAPSGQLVTSIYGHNSVSSDSHTKHTNTLCGQRLQHLIHKPSGTVHETLLYNLTLNAERLIKTSRSEPFKN
jgi:hypothetical protein